MKVKCHIILMAVSVLLFASCGRLADETRDDTRPRIVATTTIVGDIVGRIAGADMRLDVLTPPGADPHDYIFRPVDMVRATDADLIFINGAGLEGHLNRLLHNVAHAARVVDLSQGIPVRHFEGPPHDKHDHHCEGDAVDPHFWVDPTNVIIWSRTITDALSTLAPEQADVFAERRDALIAKLEELDQWIRKEVENVPREQRLLVTDHHAMGYFADRYGFEEAGVVIASFDSVAQPSAREMARLIETLRARRIPAIFVGVNVNPQVAAQVARDTGTYLVPLYSGSLSEPNGPAPDYFSYMRFNVSQIVEYLTRLDG